MRGVIVSLLLLAVTGCQYGPLEHRENQPQIADAFIERDFIVSGTSFITYRENADGNIGDFICTVEQDVAGWAADELNDSTCIGCDDVYTIGLTTVGDGDCELGGAASADIGFTPLEFFDQASEDGSFAGWLADNDADEYLNSTWYPRGPTGWEPRMGVFRGESPTSPISEGGWECGDRYCMETRYWYGTANWYAKWWLSIEVDE